MVFSSPLVVPAIGVSGMFPRSVGLLHHSSVVSVVVFSVVLNKNDFSQLVPVRAIRVIATASIISVVPYFSFIFCVY